MSIASKLKFKKEYPLYLINTEKGMEQLFGDFTLKTSLGEKEPVVKQVLLFVSRKKELNARIGELVVRADKDVILWIAYPKKSSGIDSDLNRDEGWTQLGELGYDGVASVAIDDKWSAVRFRKLDPDKKYKRSVPMEERKTEGIDYIKRTVQLPADALEALSPHKGLTEFFYAMSFSHQREYAEAIVEAKKPETRQRRIEKMIEALVKMKTEKEKKKK